MEILNEILSDLLKDKKINCTLASTPYEELGFLHFSVGMYIRNKYLWRDSGNFRALSLFYNTYDVDKISKFIIKDLYSLLHQK